MQANNNPFIPVILRITDQWWSQVELLAKKYEEKYMQTGDVTSKLTLDQSLFRDIQERKMELYNAIVKMEQGELSDGVLQERAEKIQTDLDELVKALNERCKDSGLRSKPTSLAELPFGMIRFRITGYH
ncbi:uncharacterized protein LOC114578514 [Dendrobium catenatum]|uniref:uncharacterized protein LOC114578514 n=1 Tax=Dendrobium catenatum TaxID=906689 RepID=UPI0010A055B5|nr:uncharacterized protein LOC114578514 [Dendrobium catenatum]